MLAPRIARWVEVRGRLDENAVNDGAALSPSLPLTSTYAGLGRRASMLVFFVSPSCLRAFVLSS